MENFALHYDADAMQIVRDASKCCDTRNAVNNNTHHVFSVCENVYVNMGMYVCMCVLVCVYCCQIAISGKHTTINYCFAIHIPILLPLFSS